MNPASPLRPWYAQRWPWLLMLGPAIVIVAGIITTWLAVTRQDAMVVDDYYKKGKAINQDLRRDRAASALRMSFEGGYNPITGMLSGTVSSFERPFLAPLHIRLAHATLPQKDIAQDIVPDAQGRFSVKLGRLDRSRWQVVVEGQQRDWRLARAWHWPREGRMRLDADPVAAP